MLSAVRSNIRNSVKLFNNNGIINYTKKHQPYIDTGFFKGRNPAGRRIIEGNHNVNYDKDFIRLGRDKFSLVENHMIEKVIPNVRGFYSSYGSIGLRFSNLGKNVSLYSTHPYSSIFLKNMFHPYTTLIDKNIDIFHFPFTNVNIDGVPEASTMIDLEKNQVLIYGSGYAGEIKKSVFVMMNYHCLENNILPMHCSAHLDKKTNKTSLFFGLSGTGKTTHSLREDRVIIGDDEHGWSSNGIFNFENGFYAKTDGINENNEPLIYKNIYGTSLCENVKVKNDEFDFDDTSITKNGRVSIPLDNLKGNLYYGNEIAKHPNYIFFLSCDVTGVLPHCVKLNKQQALDYYLLGFTSKTPGTEQGIQEPTITFSPCFGKVFMPHKLDEYRKIFSSYLDKHSPEVYMINTGWVNGDFKSGYRIDLEKTRETIDLIQQGKLNNVKTEKDNIFGFEIPKLNHLTSSENLPHLNKDWEVRASSLKQTFDEQLRN